ncbi:MAG: class C sortase [Clostridiales bacterium]|nr:class C sortase [Clostridiales bacterium]
MAYPFIANRIYTHSAKSIVETYAENVDTMTEEEIEEAYAQAQAYNEALLHSNVQLQDPFSEEIIGLGENNYEDTLNLDGNGMMGSVEIPCINVNLPIYHTTQADVLEKGIGHLEGTSLPVGGASTHTVLTGHTGLGTKKLFADLSELEIGDVFYIKVLGRTLAYEADQILVVEPTELSTLEIEEGEDLCTLVTCTPYGINSHRLLVRGHRIAYSEDEETAAQQSSLVTGSQWMKQYRRALTAALILIVAVFLTAWVSGILKKKHEKKKDL